MKKLVLLALCFVLMFTACSNYRVEITEPESGAQSTMSEDKSSEAEPESSSQSTASESIQEAAQEYYEFPAELVPLLDKENVAWQEIGCKLTRTKENLAVSISGRSEELLALAINSMKLRKASEGETEDYYLAYPFTAEFSVDDYSVKYSFEKGIVVVDGVNYVPSDSMKILTEDSFRNFDYISSELFTLGSKLQYNSENITKIEADISEETAVYEGEDAKKWYDEELSLWVVRNRRLTPGNTDNPSLGVSSSTYKIYFADGTMHEIGESGLVWVDGETPYFFVAHSYRE